MQLMPSKCNLFSFNRVKQLDRFHFVILQEIENFEKDSQSLNNMEKELLVCSFNYFIMEKKQVPGKSMDRS